MGRGRRGVPTPRSLKDLPIRNGATQTVPADTRFFQSNSAGRTAGGLIALDGVHPTTIGYGILAQAALGIIHTFPGTAADSNIDFSALVTQDTLVSHSPVTVTPDFHIVGWINKHIDIVSTLLRRL